MRPRNSRSARFAMLIASGPVTTLCEPLEGHPYVSILSDRNTDDPPNVRSAADLTIRLCEKLEEFLLVALLAPL